MASSVGHECAVVCQPGGARWIAIYLRVSAVLKTPQYTIFRNRSSSTINIVVAVVVTVIVTAVVQK